MALTAYLVVLLTLLAALGRAATTPARRPPLRRLHPRDLPGFVAAGVHALLTLPPRTPR
ncbi:hypothetical protein [Vallicoccus soli]|uniref:hypothetical protein n=1 Tax=Vallicoccus soli TaxID=2339232 RepID=UPI00140414FE|nr:hypothetical protein [Vallicoccus soli]